MDGQCLRCWLSLGIFKGVEQPSQFNEQFIKSYTKDSNIIYFLEVDAHYPEKLHELHNDLPFLHEKMKICYTLQKFQISIKSWVSIERIA